MTQYTIPVMTENFFPLDQDENFGKDTHMDLDLDMWITHNRNQSHKNLQL
jgi:hypothetical protein